MLMRVVAVEKIRFDLQNPVEAEGVPLKNLIERNSASLGFVNGVVGFIERTRFLIARSSSGVARSVLLMMTMSAKAICSCASGAVSSWALGVDHGHDRVELRASAHVFIDEECLSHRRGIRKAGRLPRSPNK